MRVSTALLDFPNAVRAVVFNDHVSDVSGGATRHCDLLQNTAWKRRCLTFSASARQTNKHEETAVVIKYKALTVMRRHAISLVGN